MRRTLVLLVTLGSIAAVLVGCGGGDVRPEDEAVQPPQPAVTQVVLEGTAWQATRIASGDGALTEVIDPAPTALFSSGEVTGDGTVNQYGGSYELDGSSLTVTLGASTLMAGPPERMDQESAYFAALARVKSYAIAGDVLTLSNTAGETVVEYRAVTQDLTKGEWVLIAYNDGADAVTSVLEGTTVTALFGADGTLAGNAGCNEYSGSYEVDGEGFAIVTPLAATKMACLEPEGVMEQEAAFLAAWDRVTTFAITGDRLIMTDAEGARQLEFSLSQ